MEPVEIAGVEVPQGALVVVCTGSANHDERRYDDPEKFDPDRDAKPHIAFGTGRHQCLGMHLARLELRVGVTPCSDRLPNLRLDPDAAPVRVEGIPFRSPPSCPCCSIPPDLFDPTWNCELKSGNMAPNMDRLEQIVSRLPEALRVDIEAWGGEPTFRVNGKNFVFTNPEATVLSVKLSKDEAEAVVATDPQAVPTGYGLGRSGWVTVTVGKRASHARWREVEEWVRTSYTLVAPKKLARSVLESDALELLIRAPARC